MPSTGCFRDLDSQSKIIIIESLFANFEESIIFEAAGIVSIIGLSLKSNHHKQVIVSQ